MRLYIDVIFFRKLKINNMIIYTIKMVKLPKGSYKMFEKTMGSVQTSQKIIEVSKEENDKISKIISLVSKFLLYEKLYAFNTEQFILRLTQNRSVIPCIKIRIKQKLYLRNLKEQYPQK